MTVQATERLTAGDGIMPFSRVAPDGRRLAFTMMKLSLRLWSLPLDAATGRVLGVGEPVTEPDVQAQESDLSPDGRRLAYRTQRPGSPRTELWVTDLATGHARRLVSDDQYRFSPQWSRDGMRLAYGWQREVGDKTECALAVRHLDRDEEQLIMTPMSGGVQPSDWSLDDRAVLASFKSPAELTLFPLSAAPKAEAAAKFVASDANHSLWQANLSPDGRWIAFVAAALPGPSSITVAVMPSVGGDARHWIRLTAAGEFGDKPRWSPDGRLIYFTLRRGDFYNLWAVRFDGVHGKVAGAPFQITHYDSIRHELSPFIGTADISVSERRLILPIYEHTGSIWMLDNVDR
jgi:Tol biopolymer transport system component